VYEESRDEMMQLFMIQTQRTDEAAKEEDDDSNMWEYNNFFDDA